MRKLYSVLWHALVRVAIARGSQHYDDNAKNGSRTHVIITVVAVLFSHPTACLKNMVLGLA
jgi:hypothetical protein